MSSQQKKDREQIKLNTFSDTLKTSQHYSSSEDSSSSNDSSRDKKSNKRASEKEKMVNPKETKNTKTKTIGTDSEFPVREVKKRPFNCVVHCIDSCGITLMVLMMIAFILFIAGFITFACFLPYFQYGASTFAMAATSLISACLLLVVSECAMKRAKTSMTFKLCCCEVRCYMFIRLLASLVIIVCLLLFIAALAWSLRLLMFSFPDAVIFTAGSYSDRQSRILVRSTTAKIASVQYSLDIENKTESWTKLQEIMLTLSSDFTTVYELNNLLPSTKYKAVLLLDGQVTNNEVRWKTLPDPGANETVKFTFSSCIFRWWWRGLVGFDAVNELSPDFMFFLGNFIYADRPMWIGSSKEIYDSFYREIYSDPYFTNVYTKLPMYYLHSDHEIAENWDRGTNSDTYKNAIAAWMEYNGKTNPQPLRKGTHYYALETAKLGFFALDVISYRSSISSSDTAEKTMLGKTQLADLKAWLKENNDIPFKFLVSALPWSQNFGAQNGWADYLTERNEILDFVEKENITGVILLSGGFYSSAVIEIRRGIFEISVSPLDAFATTAKVAAEPDRTLWAQGDRHYIGYIEAHTSNPPTLTVTVYDTDKDIRSYALPVYNHIFKLKNGQLTE